MAFWNAFGGLDGRAEYATPGEWRRFVYLRSPDMARIRAGVQRLGPDHAVEPAPAAEEPDDADHVRIVSPPPVPRCAASAASVLEFHEFHEETEEETEKGTEKGTEDGAGARETGFAGSRASVRPAKKNCRGSRTETQSAAADVQHERDAETNPAS